MTPTPTPEQIEAEMFTARCCTTDRHIATALATARIEERNAALDEAAEIARDEDGRFTWAGEDRNVRLLQETAGWIAEAIIALKTKEPA